MSVTTSYFAVCKKQPGTIISIARMTPRWMGSIERIVDFAPSQKLLADYKQDLCDWKTYVDRFAEEQKNLLAHSTDPYDSLLARAQKEPLVLCCYEKFEGLETKCHRLLVVDHLKNYVHQLGDHPFQKTTFISEQPYRRLR